MLGLIGGVGLLVGLRQYAAIHGYFDPASAGSATIAQTAALPEVQESTPSAGVQLPKLDLPSEIPANVQSPEIRYLGMAWNAQLSLAAAVGGPQTTRGSLMEKHGVNFHFIREDDVGKMQTQLISFASDLAKGNAQPSDGAHFMAIMGDGSAATLAGIWPELQKLGNDYLPEVVGSPGYSRGEDKLMGPAEWKDNPGLMRGSLVAGFLRDGDWNIGVNYAGSNNIPNNPDEHTYDPDAVNWYAADDFLKAAEAYISGVCEDRPVVHAGKRTGESKHICVNAVVTWTPGDVNIAKGRGGIVSIASTKEYRSQMPATIIGIRKWDHDNKPLLEEALSAMYEAADQIKVYPDWLQRGAQAEAKVYKEQDAEYWAKYFKGVREADKTGIMVDLGGSSVNNLQDAILLFGLIPGKPNLFEATYTTFGNIVTHQYPKLVPSFPPVSQVLNTAYTQDLQRRQPAVPVVPADTPKILSETEIKNKLSSKNWQINFDTGKASVAESSIPQLVEMKNGLNVSNGLPIEIQGHTDNTGNPDNNLRLSQARAEFVKNWLVTKGFIDPDLFVKVKGYGDTQPAFTNETDSGRAKNRRVVVIVGR
jgi:outer membrane protein OmpA-like peptidoglycan-associated protein